MRMPESALFFCCLTMACAHRSGSSSETRIATSPAAADCTYLGHASGSATEQTQPQARRAALDHLAADAERLGGTYVQVTGEDTNKVEMALDAIEIRFEARVYRCANGEADRETARGAATANVVAATSDPDAGLRHADVTCPAPSEQRPLDPADGP